MDDIRRFGRYEVISPLGKGAMGVVFLCRDPHIGRTVAIKTVPLSMTNAFDRDEIRERLIKEAQAAGVLSHPNIVTIFDVGEEGDFVFIVMEYLEGTALSDIILSKAPMSFEDTLTVSEQIGGCLDYAHGKGIIHRDVKPANIMRLDEGRFKLMDFGIARVFDATMTQPGEIVGSPIYMSPEQINGEELNGLSDLYSLATVMFEMLTGCRPFEGDNFNSIVLAKFENRRPLATELNHSLPSSMENFFDRVLAVDKSARFESAADLTKELRSALYGQRTTIGYSGFRPLHADTVVRTKPPGGPTAVGKPVSPRDPRFAETIAVPGKIKSRETGEQEQAKSSSLDDTAKERAAAKQFGLSTSILKAYSQLPGAGSPKLGDDAPVPSVKRKGSENKLKVRAAHRLYDHTTKTKIEYREDLNEVARKLQADPDNLEMIFRMGRIQQRLENYSEALAHFRRILRMEYEFTEAYDAIGEVYYKLKKEDKAYAIWGLSEMLQDRRKHTLPSENYYRLGKQLERENLLRAAIEVWEEALLVEPYNISCLRDLAQYYLKMRDYANSIRVHKEIVGLDGNDAVAHRNLAVSLQNSKRYKEALAAWEKALQVEDKGPGANTARRQIQVLKQVLR
jgi:serine/threonine protein kinase/Flp pilus assembly protein TadD